MLKFKQLIIGILIGALVFGGIPVFAAQYILTQAQYKIVVNGVEYTDTENPILNYNGTTYVPLRAIGKLLGNEPRWNEEKRQVEIGYSADIDLSQWIDLKTLFKEYGVEIVSGSKFILKKGDITYTLTPINGNIKDVQYLRNTNGPEQFACLVDNNGRAYLKISDLEAAGLLD